MNRTKSPVHDVRLGATFVALALTLAFGCRKEPEVAPSQLTTAPASAPATPEPKASLYDRLGGIHPIAAVVDDFLNRLSQNEVVLKNPNVKKAMEHITPAGLKYLVTEFVASAIGGPQTYSGYPLKDVHAPMNLTEAEWGALVGDFKGSLAQFKVPEAEQAELIQVLGSTHDIVIGTHAGEAVKVREPKGEPDSLYRKLGGIHPIAAVVDDFLNRLGENPVVLKNEKVKAAMARITAPGLKFLVTGFVCSAIGGPETYAGRPLKDVHTPMEIKEEHWNALVSDLQASLDKFKVPKNLQAEFLKVLGTTHDLVVTP